MSLWPGMDREDAEPTKLDTFGFGQVVGDELEEALDEPAAGPDGYAQLLGKGIGQLYLCTSHGQDGSPGFVQNPTSPIV